jgi:hypothetical protein
VGSGKSTIGVVLLEWYHETHPTHDIYILDFKRRFIPVNAREDGIFPEGPFSKNHGRINGVSVQARLLQSPHIIKPRKPGIYLIQSPALAMHMLVWLMKNHDVRRPVMVYDDETAPLHRNNQLDYRFKEYIILGREMGLGHISASQRPRRIDTVLLSESDRLYVGNMNHIKDRQYVAEMANIEDPRVLWKALPKHVFWAIDQGGDLKGIKFKVEL